MLEKFNCASNAITEIHKLQPNPKNPNHHPQPQIELLAKIIDYQGQRSPVVVSKRSGFITKGHGRRLAMLRLGWNKCAVDYQDYESEAQEYADMIADNKISELAEHNDAKMIEDIRTIEGLNLEMLAIPDLNMNPMEVDLPTLSDAPKADLRQITFTLSNDQFDLVNEAVEFIKKDLPTVDTNSNKNGNAIYNICKVFLETNGVS